MEKIAIIQGAISDLVTTQQVINSIRDWHDGRIILSCWKSDERSASLLKYYDALVCADDPGPGPFNGKHPVQQHCNLYRQLIGVKSCLSLIENDGLIFKIRNDCVVTKNVFNYYLKEKADIFDNKIVCGNMMTIDPLTPYDPSPRFRVSDWFSMGLKKDIEIMYDIFDVVKNTDYSRTYIGTEQMWATSLIKKHVQNIDIYNLNSSEYLSLAINYIYKNFIVYNMISTLGIKNLKSYKNQPEFLNVYLTEQQFRNNIEAYYEKNNIS